MSKQDSGKRNQRFRFVHESDETVPDGLRCPCCHQNFQILLSRRQQKKSSMDRLMYFYYRCGVCDHRFRYPKSGGIATLVFCGLAVITLPVLFTLISFI